MQQEERTAQHAAAWVSKYSQSTEVLYNIRLETTSFTNLNPEVIVPLDQVTLTSEVEIAHQVVRPQNVLVATATTSLHTAEPGAIESIYTHRSRAAGLLERIHRCLKHPLNVLPACCRGCWNVRCVLEHKWRRGIFTGSWDHWREPTATGSNCRTSCVDLLLLSIRSRSRWIIWFIQVLQELQAINYSSINR